MAAFSNLYGQRTDDRSVHLNIIDHTCYLLQRRRLCVCYRAISRTWYADYSDQ